MGRLFCAAILSAPLLPALLLEEDPWRAAGHFDNDTWLPRDVELERGLASADEALSEDAASLDEVFSAWRAALMSGANDGWVRWDTRMYWEAAEVEPPLWNERRVEGLVSAILLRLSAKESELLEPWLQFIEAEAKEALDAALSLPVERLRGPLATLSSRYPGTRASVRAALILSELDRELSRPHHARAWLARAEDGARLLADEELLAAAAARDTAQRAQESERWETADTWAVMDFVNLKSENFGSLASGVPGITRWNDEEVFVQGAERAWIFGANSSVETFALKDLAQLAGQPLANNWKWPGSAWRHQPSAQGELALCVLGRVSDPRSNALIAFHPGSPPVPSWSLGEGGWRAADGSFLASLEQAIGPGAWEFQPQPLPLDDLLIVQARRWDLAQSDQRALLVNPARPEAVALALDLKTGALVWRSSLARGSDLFAGSGERFSTARTPALSAPAPVLCGANLAFATGLGACALLDLADGRPQRAVLGQRVEDGFNSAAAPTATELASVLWAPYGGVTVYELALGTGHPDLRSSPFTHAPHEAREWSSVIGTLRGRPLVAIASGGRHQVEHMAKGPLRASRSVQLSLGEVLVGAHALGSERLLTASDRGLFVFDLTRDLYLVGHIPLKSSDVCLGDGLVTAGSKAWLLTKKGVYRMSVQGSD